MKFPIQALFLAGAFGLLMTVSGCSGNTNYTVKSEIVEVESLDQIVMMHDSLVKPLLYTNIKGLGNLPFSEAKTKFISAILPAILVAKHQIQTGKNKINRLREKKRWNKADSSYYLAMKVTYKAKNLEDLMVRLGTLPNSVVLAQAAIETGWGESRFFVQASNLFGVWSFDENEDRIAAYTSRNNKTIFLRSYDDMSGSIADYFEVLARHSAYRNLRKARLQTSDPFKLIPHLKNYSERKRWYTSQLKKVIMQNNLTKYDRYRIDPAYLVEE